MRAKRTEGGQILVVAMAAGLAGAVSEMAFVLPIQALVLHVSPERVFQYIASGAIGRAAFAGGVSTAVQGALWHLLISVLAAGTYGLAASRWVALLRRPFLGGMILGLIAYAGMINLVLPLSRIGFAAPRFNILTVVSLAIHLFAFGLPIALTTSALLKAEKRR